MAADITIQDNDVTRTTPTRSVSTASTRVELVDLVESTRLGGVIGSIRPASGFIYPRGFD